jgi:hypothetical protein
MSVSIFFSYSHKDEALRDCVAEALSALKRSHVIQEWHDRQIPPGSEWKDEIDRNLRTADIILLLVSASFLSSDYCWSEELQVAMDRHEAQEACVIPIILRPCDWQETPFAKLQALPKDAKAVTLWSNEDEALTDVAQSIRMTVKQVMERKNQPKVKARKPEPNFETPQVPMTPPALPKQPPEDDLQSEKGIDYAPLRDMLKAGKWHDADRATWRVMCAAAGRQEEGYLRVEDVERFPCEDLRTIDQLWVKYSDGKFGFSIQKQIWQECGSPKNYNKEYKFRERIGWCVKNNKNKWITYPNDVTYDISALKGHLPFWYSRRGGVTDGFRSSLFSRRDTCEL